MGQTPAGKFTKEFKLAAVRRLEQGVSMAEAARALEVEPNVLIAGARSWLFLPNASKR